MLESKLTEDDEYLILREDLPPMMASEEEFQKLDGQTGGAKTFLQAQFVGSFILQLFLSGALS